MSGVAGKADADSVKEKRAEEFPILNPLVNKNRLTISKCCHIHSYEL